MTGEKWWDKTRNSVAGCSRISPGCDNCYAEKMSRRLGWGRLSQHAPTRDAYKAVINPDTGKWNGRMALLDNDLWLTKKPQRVFVGSMTDPFIRSGNHYAELHQLREVATVFSDHTFLLLTKRAGNMQSWCKEFPFSDNVQLGVTAENQEWADTRIPHLLSTPAACRFVSCEPLLGPIDFNWIRESSCATYSCLKRRRPPGPPIRPPDIDGVIVGGETGPGARPMHPDWVRSIRDQCVAAGVPFFFKGYGAWVFVSDRYGPYDRYPSGQRIDISVGIDGRTYFLKIDKKRAGRLLDGREWNELPGGRKCGNCGNGEDPHRNHVQPPGCVWCKVNQNKMSAKNKGYENWNELPERRRTDGGE